MDSRVHSLKGMEEMITRDEHGRQKPDKASISRMVETFGPPPWVLPVEKPVCWPDEALQFIEAVDLHGVLFVRRKDE